VKRIFNRNLQRQAALEFILRDDLDSQDQDVLPVTRKSPVKSLILPVIEPSIFWLQSFNPAEWITIQRNKKRIAHRCISRPTRSMRGPRMHEFSSDRASVKRFHSKANSCFSRSVITDQTGVDDGRCRYPVFQKFSLIRHKAQYIDNPSKAHLKASQRDARGLSGDRQELRQMHFNLGLHSSSSRLLALPSSVDGVMGRFRMAGSGERFPQGGSQMMGNTRDQQPL
jgi:hypothetical protein